jgi:hypothetical protein
LSFFYSGGTPVGGASPLGDIKTPPCARPGVIAVIVFRHCVNRLIELEYIDLFVSRSISNL